MIIHFRMSGYQRASKTEFGDDHLVQLDKSINRYRWFLLFFNILSVIVALATFCVCIWIRYGPKLVMNLVI